MDRPSQINSECNVLGNLLVRDEWKYNGSTREAPAHEGIICKVSGRKMTGDTGKAVHDKRSRITTREFLAQKGTMEISIFDFLNWDPVDKIMDNSPQQLCLWVTKHVSKICGTKKCYTSG